MLRICLAMIAVAAAMAQDFAAAGAYYSHNNSPKVTGWALFARPVTEQRVFAIALVEGVPVKTESGDLLIESRYQGGAAILLAKTRWFSVYGTGELGAAVSNRYTTMTGGGAVCFATRIRGPWRLFIPVRYSNTLESRYRVSVGLGIAVELD